MAKRKKEKEEDALAERMRLLRKGFNHTGNVYGRKEEKQKKKRKEKKMSSEGIYNVTLMNFQFHLYEIICEINDIPLDYYMAVDTINGSVQLVNDLILDETFKSLSGLKWEEPAGIDTLYFRGRFCTCLLYKLVRMSHRVVKGIHNAVTDDDKHKYRIRHAILQQWIQIVDTFAVNYLSAKQNYVPSLLKIYELLTYTGKGSEHVLEYLKDTERLIRNGKESEGIETNDITKMAFVLATDSLRLGKCPAFREDFKYEDFNGALEQVGGLGYAIMNRRIKDNRKPPIMFVTFQMANPKIVSRFYQINQEAPEVTVGLKALEFSKIFYENDIRARKLIDRIM